MATADVSDPPLPSVVIFWSLSTPWNPVIITILFSFRFRVILDVSIPTILAFWKLPSVRIPACHPLSEIASFPKRFNKMASFEAVICSPTLIRASSSLLSGIALSSLASLIKLSVVLPCAETITTTSFPFLLKAYYFVCYNVQVSIICNRTPSKF